MRWLLLSLALTLASGSATASAAVIGFNGLTTAGPFATTIESGFSIAPVSGNWIVSTGFGHPAPFIEFINAVAGATTAAVAVTGGDSPFTFTAVDLYSSVTPIPYVFTGLRQGSLVFSATGVVPNTFGTFATVSGTGLPIDTLVISLTNQFVGNPMGLDNIVVTTVPEPATLALVAAGLAGLGFRRRRHRRPSAGL